MLECLENNYNITILFHAYTGLGKQRMVRYPNGFESITWEYIETFSREEFFIRPNFSFENSLASFYARFFSREEIVKRIEELMK